jgi:UDP-N-acetyl-D-mannosaminuronate dehydrogenase
MEPNESNKYSTSPSGEQFLIPTKEEYEQEYKRVEQFARKAREDKKEIVVVMGVGFVGAVMAAIIADTKDDHGKNTKFVIGCQRPSFRSFWKIPLLNRGESPVTSEDEMVDELISKNVLEQKTLMATYNNDCLKLADVVVVDVQCDFTKKDLGFMKSGETNMTALEETIRIIGQKIPPHCLVLIETTVAPGTTEFVAWPILKKAFYQRNIQSDPVLAHSFERVMPGKDYVRSIRDFWRVCSGCTPEARKRVEHFLRDIINTNEYPLTVMDRPIESEMLK